MGRANPATQKKRNRERAKQEKQREKQVEKALRKERRKIEGENAIGGDDPDIAGIVPGPQPRYDD